LSLNVVSSWWAEEAKSYGLAFDEHDDRYGRTREWLEVVKGLWREPQFTFHGERYRLEAAICEPKPVAKPMVYAGGESEAAKALIAERCDAYVMHGDEPGVVAAKIADMKVRRAAYGGAPMVFGMAAYAIVRPTRDEALAEAARITTLDPQAPGFANFNQWVSGTELERELKIQEYSVSNRGLRPGLVGTAAEVRERIAEFEAAGLDLLLLQMSPQYEEMERFAAEVIET
jgi:FMNH2-dependent dimethyl sulfone monooxygenase